MAKKAEEVRQDYVLDQDVHVAGQECRKGGTLSLTNDEVEALKAAGVRFSGDPEPTPEEVQAKHDEGVAAFNEAVTARQEAEPEAVNELE